MTNTVNPTGASHEIPLEDMFFSTTDRRGVIGQANEVFSRLARRPMDELVGQPHNIIRHPDMPSGAFKIVWDMLQSGRATSAYVKNLAGDGSTYWAFATIVPTADGYLSVRCRPLRHDLATAADTLYQAVRPAELAARAEGKSAAEAAQLGATLIEEHLAAAGFAGYEGFIRTAVPAEAAARVSGSAGLPRRPLATGHTGTVLFEATRIDAEVRGLTQALGESQDSALQLHGHLDAARAALADLVAALDDAKSIAAGQADKAPLVASSLPGLQEKCAGVADVLARVAEQLTAVEDSRAALRFSAALAQLQAEIVGRFTIARMDGQESEADFDAAVEGLAGCLERGLGALSLDAGLDRTAVTELRAELEQTGPSLRITRMMLRRWMDLVDEQQMAGFLSAQMPVMEAKVTELSEQLKALAGATETFTESSVGFDSSSVDEMLRHILTALPARA